MEYFCPHCEAAVAGPLVHGEDYTCASCSRTFRVPLDGTTGKAGFFEHTARPGLNLAPTTATSYHQPPRGQSKFPIRRTRSGEANKLLDRGCRGDYDMQ